jgi:hypothetical protein
VAVEIRPHERALHHDFQAPHAHVLQRAGDQAREATPRPRARLPATSVWVKVITLPASL